MQTRRARLRGGLLLGFYAVAGAGLALLVAAACAIWMPVGAPRRVDAQVEQTATAQNWRLASPSKQDNPTLEMQSHFRWLSGLVEPEWMQHYQQPGMAWRVLEWQVAGGVGIETERLLFGYMGDDFPSAMVLVSRVGWPMTCISGEISFTHGGYGSNRVDLWGAAVPVPGAFHPVTKVWSNRAAGGRGDFVGLLPARIERFGLAINALVFGAALWIAVRIPRTLRRTYRRYRGECLNCGYSRAGISEATPCPECGAASGSGLPLP